MRGHLLQLTPFRRARVSWYLYDYVYIYKPPVRAW